MCREWWTGCAGDGGKGVQGMVEGCVGDGGRVCRGWWKGV